MKCNVGRKDSKLRLIGGAVLLVVAVFAKSWILGLLAVIAIATGAFRFCPAYLTAGINTMRPGNDKDTDDAFHETTEQVKEAVHDVEEAIEHTFDSVKDKTEDNDKKD